MRPGTSIQAVMNFNLLCVGLAFGLFTGCGEKSVSSGSTPVAKHEHLPPHGGTRVVLGSEEYHLELVRDAVTGTMRAYVMDGELENFVRIPAASFEVEARLAGRNETLVFTAVASAATGEIVGDTALFQAEDSRLKSIGAFDAVLRELTVRGRKFNQVAFNFPEGNHDAGSDAK